MNAMRLDFLVEEESAERLIRVLAPRIIPGVTFDVRRFPGKAALLRELPQRMRGYSQILRLDPARRVLVLVDRDDDDCIRLKSHLEQVVRDVGLPSLSNAGERTAIVATRIAVEELEAWIFGDVDALREVYPRLPDTLGRQTRYRDPDAITGGTWEALERVLQKHGYHTGGLPKILVAENVARHMNVEANRSRSFVSFRDGVRRLIDPRRVA